MVADEAIDAEDKGFFMSDGAWTYRKFQEADYRLALKGANQRILPRAGENLPIVALGVPAGTT
jgi:hypothetical protein